MKIVSLLLTSLLFISCRGLQVGAVVHETFSAQAGRITDTEASKMAGQQVFTLVSMALRLGYVQQALKITEQRASAPAHFKGIDFEKHRYPYKFWYGRKIEIAFIDGEFRYDYRDGRFYPAVDIDRGWFSFNDVYYIDLTGDGKEEVLLELGHVGCGDSCDGGAALYYAYTLRGKDLQEIWRYETGSTGYGCGLKSLTIKQRKITLELFVKCSDDAQPLADTEGKFLMKDLTRLEFAYNGSKIVKVKKTFIDTPAQDVKNRPSETSIEK